MQLGARDESGNPVDWWFIYKVPKLHGSTSSDKASGYEYSYFDAHSQSLSKSTNTLDQENGALRLTLQALFHKPADTTGWILYNDEKPRGRRAKPTDNEHLGHCKGVLAFDTKSKTGFWLLHSWPQFPQLTESELKRMPTPDYGQTFLCLSLDLATLNKIAAQMAEHQEPQCFDDRAANITHSEPLFALTRKLSPHPEPQADVIDCQTRGGMKFKVLAKNREWKHDFWNDFVVDQLKVNLRVETWIRGKVPPITDPSGTRKSDDIKFIDFNPLGIHYSWSETNDHAKWGISETSNWICVGDINRMISQENRGGGTIAFQHSLLWAALSKTDRLDVPAGHTRESVVAHLQQGHAKPRRQVNQFWRFIQVLGLLLELLGF